MCSFYEAVLPQARATERERERESREREREREREEREERMQENRDGVRGSKRQFEKETTSQYSDSLCP